MLANPQSLTSLTTAQLPGNFEWKDNPLAGGFRHPPSPGRQPGSARTGVDEHPRQGSSQPCDMVRMVEESNVHLRDSIGGRHGGGIVRMDVEDYPCSLLEKDRKVETF